MTDDPESFGGYYPFECIGRMEHLGIFCITVDRAAYVISKHGDVEEFGDLEIPAHDSYLQWLEILTKGINRKTLKTAIKKIDLNDNIDVFQTAIDLFDLQDWLEERDVIFYDNTLEEIINNRTKLLHKADAFIRTMAILDSDMEKFLEVESLSDRLEAALSENRRLQRLFSASANGDIKPVDSSENKRSASATINIVGALCDLYWKMKHPDNPKINQAEIISALESYKDYDGLSERNLKDKLSKGIKAVRFE